MPNEISGREARALAGRLIRTMHRRKDDRNITITAETMEDIRTLAGSVLTQSPDMAEQTTRVIQHMTKAGAEGLLKVYRSGAVLIHRVDVMGAGHYLAGKGLIDVGDDGFVRMTPLGYSVGQTLDKVA